MTHKVAALSIVILLAALLEAYALYNSPSTAPVGLAAPTDAFFTEAKVIAIIFVLFVLFMQPIKSLYKKYAPPLGRFFEWKVKTPLSVRIAALVAVLVGGFVTAFWMTADVLGGLNGYGYSFDTHPFLPAIYNDFDLRYITLFMHDIHQSDVGAESTLFFSIAILGLVVFQLNRGVGLALKDTITIFAATAIIIFELALWYYATQDMSWHVATFLSIGGVADGGYRRFDNGSQYLISNWFVLFVSCLLVATRLPGLGWPSRTIWNNKILGKEALRAKHHTQS